MLATTMGDQPFDWEYYIQKVWMAYNTSIESTTGYSPFFLVLGHQARMPVDVMDGTECPKVTTHGELATIVKSTLERTYDIMREKTGMQQERQKEYYDRKVYGEPFSVRDHVWLHSPVVPRGKSRKLHHPWTEPWLIVKKLSDVVYRLQFLTGRRKRVVVHFDQLKLCPQNMRLNTSNQPGANRQHTVLCEAIRTCTPTDLELVDEFEPDLDDALVPQPPPPRTPSVSSPTAPPPQPAELPSPSPTPSPL